MINAIILLKDPSYAFSVYTQYGIFAALVILVPLSTVCLSNR